MNQHYLSPLFHPSSIVVYLDEAEQAPSGRLLREALGQSTYSGAVGLRFIDDAGGVQQSGDAIVRPDVALIAAGSSLAHAALSDAVACRARSAILYDAADTEWAALQAIAAQHRLHLLGPGSSGFQRPPLRLNACVAGPAHAAGHLALVSQSGALTAAMLDWADSHAIRFSLVAATGRSAMLDLADVLDYLAQDNHTHSIVLYMEGIRSGRRFMSALRMAARSKPVIVLKAGRRERGREAALTHSGTIIGGDDVFDAAIRRAGAVRVDSFVQLFSAAKCLVSRYRPVGNRLGVIGNGGGPGVLAADYAHLRGVDLPPLDAPLMETLRAKLPGAHSVANPVDLGEGAGAAEFVAAAETLSNAPGVDGVLVVVTPKPGIDTEAIAKLAIENFHRLHKPVIGCWMGETRVQATRRRVSEAGLPIFRLPEEAVDTFANIAQFYRNQQLLIQTPPPWVEDGRRAPPDCARARRLIRQAIGEGRHALTETESKELMASFGIPVVETSVARSATEAVAHADRVGYPVVVKINSPDILHKSDVGGVMLNVRTAQQVATVFVDMMIEVARRAPQARLDGVSIQHHVQKRHGRELYVGMTTDELFGPVITFGAGGTMIEVINDRAVALPPLNAFLARRLIESARAAATLGDWRGMPAADLQALETLLLRVSEMCCELPELRELDINPVIVDDTGASVVDARVVLRSTDATGAGAYDHMAILPYPAGLSRAFVSRGGASLVFRPIRPEDADALQHFVRALSHEARYFRFLSSLTELTPAMLARFTQIDYDREMAIVAAVPAPDAPDRIVGVARYLLNPDATSAEFGLVVADEWQGEGIGSGLMTDLCNIAQSRGLKEVVGLVLASNENMLGLMRRLGFVETQDPDDHDLRVVTRRLQPAA